MEDNETRGVQSTASIDGHPIHPMLVPFPITLLFSAFITDLVYAITGDPLWASFSYWLIFGGLIAGLAAGVAGAIDFFTIERIRRHSDGWIHAIGNALVIVLSLINLLIRWNDPMLTRTGIFPGLILSAVVASALVITGWYGGELSYRYLVGVVGNAVGRPNSRTDKHL
jgi:uncharacterized membrane protein